MSLLQQLIATVTENDCSMILLSGNGVGPHSQILAKVLNVANLESIAKPSQIKGAVQGIRHLLGSPEGSFYRILPGCATELKQNAYSPELHCLPPEINFPVILVNFKAGLTFYKWNSIEEEPRRVMASIFGESTVIGFIKLITETQQTQTFSEMISRSLNEGSNLRVDLTVSDIYGDGASSLGLHKDIIASSTGKSKNLLDSVTNMDYINSLVTMFSINCANLTSLIAMAEAGKSVICLNNLISNKDFNRLVTTFYDYYITSLGGKVPLNFITENDSVSALGHLLN